MDKTTMNKALAKAKIGLMSNPNAIFWSTVCMGLRHVFDEGIPTACTDGTLVSYNPKFFMEYCRNNAERTGLIFHECGHVVFQHMNRCGSRDPRLYNIAGDHVINLLALEAGFRLPRGGYADPKYKGWLTEAIYNDLVQNPPPPTSPPPPCTGGPGGAGTSGDPQNAGDLAGEGGMGQDIIYQDDPGKAQKTKEAIDDLLVRATMTANAAGKPGSVPGEIQRYVNDLVNPIIPWDAILRRFMTSFDKTRYNYKVPNRRFFPGTFLPRKQNKTLGKITIAIDASGSVTDEQFANYVSGTHTVLKRYNPTSLQFLQFSTRITELDEIKTVKDLKNLTFTGRGGTSVAPVMKWAAENKPALLIVFSDGQFRVPQINPGVPVVWIIHDMPDFTAPFGKVIHFNII